MTAPDEFPPGHSLIYIDQDIDTDEYKMGRSDVADWPARRRDYERHGKPLGEKRRMRLRAVVHGVPSDERRLHEAFPQERYEGTEWFRWSPDIEGYVHWLRRQNFVETREEFVAPPRFAHGVQWLPTPERRFCLPPRQLSWEDDPDDVGRFMESDDWFAPEELIESARETMGSIDLDPASCRAANERVAAAAFFDAEVNGLVQPWNARNVWCYPPPSAATPWGAKMLKEWQLGRVEQMCLLGYTSLIQRRGYQDLARMASHECRLFRPPRNWDNPRNKKGSAPATYSVFYFGADKKMFRHSFRNHGLFSDLENQNEWDDR